MSLETKSSSSKKAHSNKIVVRQNELTKREKKITKKCHWVIKSMIFYCRVFEPN